ncbi:restriction endonuclease subunit S [Mycoplasmopsis caviae]|uniref:Restriction endonuclease subunit S n=1 Tax=Mycoplasmopsis caviae TaxID=55603 RepID=A0ABY5IZM5_9BACT|nr:restriction endonuclease subunit S [Mycoplasmopsis caviae]UUD35069.1 restriction endonuclease subunit S [Mycoplasmopsis caviae]
MVIDIIGSIDDLIEKYEELFIAFRDYLSLFYKWISEKSSLKVELSEMVYKTGKNVKKYEWFNNNVIDLSTMKSNNICINEFSNGNKFKTNIKTYNGDLLYGSIRPYFKKAGFSTNAKFVCGTVYSFNSYKPEYFVYLLSVISSDDFHKFTSQNSKGTKMPVISWKDLIRYKFLCPNDKDLLEFNNKLIDLFNLIKSKMIRIKFLKKIKELFLNHFFKKND